MPNLEARPEVYVRGVVSPEGPAFARDGTLYFCDFGVFPDSGDPSEAKDRNIYRSDERGETKVFVNTGGMPTGAAFHRNGRLLVCDSGRGELLTIYPDSRITVLASEYHSKPLHGPNDLAFDWDSTVYFTDPKGSSLEERTGDIYLYHATRKLELFDSGYAFPNGIAIGPNRKTLYVAETHTQRIYRFALGLDGLFTEKEIFAVLPQDKLNPEHGPDGMAFDREGNLYIAHWGKGCVDVVSSDGKLLGELATPGSKPTNVAFWGTLLYVTEMEKGQVIRFDVGIPGLELFGTATESIKTGD